MLQKIGRVLYRWGERVAPLRSQQDCAERCGLLRPVGISSRSCRGTSTRHLTRRAQHAASQLWTPCPPAHNYPQRQLREAPSPARGPVSRCRRQLGFLSNTSPHGEGGWEELPPTPPSAIPIAAADGGDRLYFLRKHWSNERKGVILTYKAGSCSRAV